MKGSPARAEVAAAGPARVGRGRESCACSAQAIRATNPACHISGQRWLAAKYKRSKLSKAVSLLIQAKIIFGRGGSLTQNVK